MFGVTGGGHGGGHVVDGGGFVVDGRAVSEPLPARRAQSSEVDKDGKVDKDKDGKNGKDDKDDKFIEWKAMLEPPRLP